MAKVSAEESCTRPSLAMIIPLLITLGATSATKPASLAVIKPSFTISALGLPLRSKRFDPAIKSKLFILAVVATIPLTSTLAVPLKNTPLGLTNTILPLAESCPAIREGSALLTLFKVIAAAEG